MNPTVVEKVVGEPRSASTRTCGRFATAAGLTALAGGALVLTGWWLHADRLKSVLSGAATMKPNSAVAFMLLGAALVLLTRPTSGRKWAGRTCAIIALVVTLVTLVEYVTGGETALDTWLFGREVRLGGELLPGRMSEATAVGLLLLEMSLLGLTFIGRDRIRLGQIMALAAGLIGYVAMSAYAYDVRSLYDISWFSSLSFPTALLMFALGFGAICAQPDLGLMATVNSRYSGGWMARRLLPPALLLPLLLGWLQVAGERAYLFHAGFGLALLTSSFALVFAAAVWRQARSLNRSDEQRQQAAEQQANLAAIVESSDDAIIGLTLDGKVTSWNAGAERLFGYPRREILGQQVHQLLPADRKDEEIGILAQVVRGEMVDHWETVRQRKDGRRVDVSLSVSPVRDSAGNVVGASKVVRDITKRKQTESSLRESETRLREIAENINEVFWTFDLATQQVLFVSPAYERVWGRSCAELYRSPEAWMAGIHSDDRGRVENSFRTGQTTGTYDETYRILRPDGAIRWIHDRAFPLRDKTGNVYRIIGLAEDVTQQRNLERQLNQAQKLEALGTLAGGIAHDFNNILAAIMGYTGLARMKTTDAEVLKLLGPVQQASERAAALIRQILAFSRQQEQQRSPIQLRHITAESLHLLRATIPASIEFNENLARDLPPVLADATQIHQVIMNLGTNAWHAMREMPAGRLSIALERFEVDALLADSQPNLKAGPYVRLTVSDTGKGMDRATLDRIFEPFFTTKAPGEGTGLGLSVVHGIIRNHDGAITVYSHRNEGTTFHLYFPALPEITATVGRELTVVPFGSGEHVLFVDDELPLAELGRKILEQQGYSVVSSTDPIAALELVRSDPDRFDLVVTDMAMPKLTGLDLTRGLRMVRPNLPVILTSGYIGGLGDEALKDAGVTEVLPKPHTVQSVGAAVHRVLTSLPKKDR